MSVKRTDVDAGRIDFKRIGPVNACRLSIPVRFCRRIFSIRWRSAFMPWRRPFMCRGRD